mgnify:CR=1 FL=1
MKDLNNNDDKNIKPNFSQSSYMQSAGDGTPYAKSFEENYNSMSDEQKKEVAEFMKELEKKLDGDDSDK